jgi:hypothetical protein
MKKTDIHVMPAYFDRYINLVDDVDILDALKKYDATWLERADFIFKLNDKVYAPGKWTVNDILQHIIDTERIFCYRALRFARADKTPLPGYDENHYADIAITDTRDLHDLLEEFQVTRQSTIHLFRSLNQETLQREGICWNVSLSVLALGFTMVGHVIHHKNVLKERYFPLLNSN